MEIRLLYVEKQIQTKKKKKQRPMNISTRRARKHRKKKIVWNERKVFRNEFVTFYSQMYVHYSV